MLILFDKNVYPDCTMDWFSRVLAAVFLFICSHSFAQILPREDQTDSGLEELYDKFENEEEQKVEQRRKVEKKSEDEEKKIELKIENLTGLSRLQPFEDVAVIQRKFLPKTSRFELSGNGLISTNNQYFNNFGVGARLAYYFKEKYGLEATYHFVSSSKRAITEGLVDNQRISTRSLVEPESYFGLAFKWSPVYGKMAWFQKKIIPFDIYFTPGLGITSTAAGGSDTTLSLGAGQLFALSKSYGVRWDFIWNYFSSEVVVDGVKE